MKGKKFTTAHRIAKLERVTTQLFITLDVQHKLLIELSDYVGYDLQKGEIRKSLLEPLDENQTSLLDSMEEIESESEKGRS